MTAIAKIPSRGVALLQSIASVYTAMQGLTKVSITGRKSTATDTTTLDGPVSRTKDPDGYADTAGIKASGFYNPSHATYTAFEALIDAPVPTNFKVTWTDSGPTSQVYSGVAFGIDTNAEPGKMVMADIEIETSGDPS